MTTTSSQPQVTPERLMNFAFGYAPPLLIEAGVRLELFDHLEPTPRTLPELVKLTGASPRGLTAAVDALVGLGLLSRAASGKIGLTPESATFLVSTKPGYLGGFFRHTSGQLIPRWLHLTESIRTGKPARAVNQEGEGSAFFEEFVEDLFALNYRAAQTVGETLGVPQARQPVNVLDLAAGSGVWSIALAEQSPQVRVTAVDWPAVLKVTQRVAQRHKVAERFCFVAGDLQAANFGTNHQIATLGHILHSEGERRSKQLLKKVHAALAPGGTIMVAEWLVNDDRTGPPQGVIFAVNMLVNTDEGDTWSFNTIKGWLEEAGFSDVRTIEAPAPSPLLLARA